MTANSPRFSLTYRDLAIAMVIVLLAFALRVIVVFDRAQGDYFFTLRDGTDQYGFMNQVEAFQRGEWPREPFYYQPGTIYYLIGIRALVGDSLGMMRLVTSLTGALSCGMMIGAGWLLTRRKWGGYLAGGLLAVYPVAIFWSTEILIPVLATFLLSVWLFLALWQRESLAWWRTAGLGILTGLLLITRSNLMLVVLAWLVLLAFIAPNWCTLLAHGLLTALCGVLVVAPVTLFNIQHGEFQLVSQAGMDEVYRANNRDTDGLRTGSVAMDVADGQYSRALMDDITRDLLHFLELMAYKTGIYLDAGESGNNLSYFESGLRVSALLRAIPLDFRVLTILSLLGLSVLLGDDRRTGVFLLLVNLLIYAGVMALWIEGRLRQPAVVPLVLTAGYLLLRVPEILRGRQWRALALPVVGLVLMLGFFDWAFGNLPTHHPIGALPGDVHVTDVVYEDKVRFWGWRTLPQWPMADEGWSVPNQSYVVQLFWELLEPVEDDYSFYLAFVKDGQRYKAVDRQIGGVSFRPTPTSEWLPNQIYSEMVGFRLHPSDHLPTDGQGEIQVGVYRWDEQGLIVNPPVTDPEGQVNILTLHTLALVSLDEVVPPPDNMIASDMVFGQQDGDQIALLGYAMPQTAHPGQTITISLYWLALDNVRADYSLFVHVMGDDGQVVAQHDGPPHNGTWNTSSWPYIMPMREDITLTLPDQPGVYPVYFGWYIVQTGVRLAADAPDNRPLLAEIMVSE